MSLSLAMPTSRPTPALGPPHILSPAHQPAETSSETLWTTQLANIRFGKYQTPQPTMTGTSYAHQHADTRSGTTSHATTHSRTQLCLSVGHQHWRWDTWGPSASSLMTQHCLPVATSFSMMQGLATNWTGN